LLAATINVTGKYMSSRQALSQKSKIFASSPYTGEPYYLYFPYEQILKAFAAHRHIVPLAIEHDDGRSGYGIIV